LFKKRAAMRARAASNQGPGKEGTKTKLSCLLVKRRAGNKTRRLERDV